MWFNRKQKNRRLGRVQVLDVKLRSSQVRAARMRMIAIAIGLCFGTVFVIYLVWRTGAWALDRLVYENKSFAILQVDIQTDGVISADQLRRWSGVKYGENLLALDLARVKRDLELVPLVQSASIERVLPNILRVRVVEREPVVQANVLRPRAGGGIDAAVFQIDGDGYVMLPLDPRQRSVPLGQQTEDQLPVIAGVNPGELQPGSRIESPQTQAALKFIAAFESSPMVGLVDLKRISVSSPEVLIVTTGQGSQVTFGLDNFERQLLRWQKVHEECARMNRVIATLDLAVTENTPLRFVEAGTVPPAAPKNKPHRKRNV
jgi:cell division septal protein FtsQ